MREVTPRVLRGCDAQGHDFDPRTGGDCDRPCGCIAADRKSGDILRCDEFSHEACGREFTYWMSHFGYHGCSEGENIAWGSGSLGTPRSIFRAWMHSQGHRENILGAYEDTGIGLRTGRLEGYGGAHVWTEEFGSQSC